MFDGIKAIIQGWKSQGAFPGLSPDLWRPYADAVVAYLEDGERRARLRLLVCESDEETLPFDFSYEVLPLSLARVMASLKSNRNDDYCRFVTNALSGLTGPLGKGRPAYEVGRLLRDPEEIAQIHRIYRATGGVASISSFARTPFPWGDLLDIVFAVRAAPMMRVMMGVHDNRGGKSKKMVALGRAVARQFLIHSTGHPTIQKEALVAEHSLRLWFVLSDIPPYAKRA